MAEAIEAQGIQGLNQMLEQMTAYKNMLEQEQSQAAEQQARQAAEDQQKETQFSAFVETAYIVAAADGRVSDAEMQRLSHGISQLTKGQISEEQVQGMVQTAASNLESQGRDARVDAVASIITDGELRRGALLVASGLAWLDRGVGEKEGLALQALAKSFGFSINELHQIMAQAK
jgi:tellurite resistance protein